MRCRMMKKATGQMDEAFAIGRVQHEVSLSPKIVP